MINVCQRPFISQTSASLIHQDGYEADNLFALDLNVRRKGYQIERFVRPPVSIDISFNAPVTICYIVVWIGLYDEKEKCKVEFFASTNKTDSLLHSSSCRAGFEKFCGSFILKSTNPYGLFHNPSSAGSHLDYSATHNEVLGSQMCERLVCQQIISQPLKPINELTTVTNLTVCIKQYTSPRALWVKCLEVWGLPSKYSTADHLKCFENARETCLLQQKTSNYSSSSATVMYHASNTVLNSPPSDSSTGVDVETPPVVKANDCVNGLLEEEPIPDKFLDQLTYEVMVLPYMLPSGHCVDQITIDKCRDADLLYGRPPGDPFTGVPYTDSSQPIFCVQLKSEIDAFTNRVRIPSETGKTAGSAKEIAKHKLLIGNKRKLSEWIPRSNSQKPCLDSSNDGDGDSMKQGHHLKEAERNSLHRKCKHDHEKTLQTSLEESLKHLYPS